MKLRTDVTAALVGALYLLDRLGRRSGVTRAEAEARLRRDELVANPMWQSTRATTIDAKTVAGLPPVADRSAW